MSQEQVSHVTYWDYIKLMDLLNLQSGLESDEQTIHEDELHFIIVHQVFELWFKLILRELRLAVQRMGDDYVPENVVPYVVHHLRRVNTILSAAADHFDVLETLRPLEFLEFREKLQDASGAHSFQFREIEFVLGLTNEERARHVTGFDPLDQIRTFSTRSDEEVGKMIVERLDAAAAETSLKDALFEWLWRTPIMNSTPRTDLLEIDSRIVADFREDYEQRLAQYDPEAHSKHWKRYFPVDASQRELRVRTGILFIESYPEYPLLAWPCTLIDTVVETEQLFRYWRTRHVRVVDRILGARSGTAGSDGGAYLEKTIGYQIFPEFFDVRTLLLPLRERPVLPPEVASLLRFSSETIDTHDGQAIGSPTAFKPKSPR